MTHSEGWRDNRRILLLFALFLVCCLAAYWTREAVDTDRFSDLASVILQIGTFAACLGAAAITIVAAIRARGLAERIVLRMLPVGLVLLAATFVKTSYADVSIALHALTAGSDDAETVIVLGPGGRDIRLSGDLTEGASVKLTALLGAHPNVQRIHLTSDGGLVDEGEALRKIIAARKLTTFVPDYCVSACTLAFLGGRERFVMKGSRLGFHAPFEEGIFNQIFIGDSSAERETYLHAGVSPDFVDHAFRIKPEDIWTPDPERLMSAHVATGVVDRYRFPDSNLDGAASQAGARNAVLRNFPLTRALDRWKTQSVDELAAWYLASYRLGLSEGEIVDGLTVFVGEAASLALVQADDETLVALGRFIDAAMEESKSDEICTAIGSNASLAGAEAAFDQDDERADKLAIALLSRALTHRIDAPAMSRSKPLSGAMTIAEPGARRSCTQMHAFYAQMLSLPQHEAAMSIRSLVAQRSRDAPATRTTEDAAFR